MILQVCYFGDPILKKQGKPVEHFDDELKGLASDMIDTMQANEGIGIAAQQIGKSLMLCVINVTPSRKESHLSWYYDGQPQPMSLQQLMPMVLVNPQIDDYSRETNDFVEGCLSFPGINGTVTRPESIHLRFQDLDGKAHTLRCNGLFSRVIQHEVDHLNGKLFIDRMDKKTMRALSIKINRLRRHSEEKIKKGKKPQKDNQ